MPLKVGVIQSNYIPWRGYFDFIDGVDLFVFYDDVQYTKNDWRNRNKIKTQNGELWLTVPVLHKSMDQLICQTPIEYSQAWQKRHIKSLAQWYAKAPFFPQYSPEVFELISQPYHSISALNIEICRWLMKQLGIVTPILQSSELQLQGTKTDRLIDLMKKVGGKIYVSGPAAKAYLQPELFKNQGFGLEYKQYEYEPYPQLWGDFCGAVSVLDLLFNTGPEARRFMKSLAPNEVAVQC